MWEQSQTSLTSIFLASPTRFDVGCRRLVKGHKADVIPLRRHWQSRLPGASLVPKPKIIAPTPTTPFPAPLPPSLPSPLDDSALALIRYDFFFTLLPMIPSPSCSKHPFRL